jgi:hypothetical protein
MSIEGLVMEQKRVEQKRGDLMITLATYIFHLYNNGYRGNNSSINGFCEKIVKETSKPSKEKLRNNLEMILKKESIEMYMPSSQKIELALQSLFGNNFIENIDLFSMGMEMVSAIESLFSEGYEKKPLSSIKKVLEELYTDFDFNTFDDNAQQNLKSIRSYQYHYKLPWIARIANRQNGLIVEEWVMVEDVQDMVLCMDPYPWDDIEEDFRLSTQEFLIRWRLCDFSGFYITKKSSF